MADKNNLIEGVVYEKRRDPDTNAMVPYSARQVVWSNTLTGDSIEQAEDAADAADSASDVGSPSISSDLEIKRTLSTLKDDGKALSLVIYGRTDSILDQVGELPDPNAWSVPYFVRVRRFLDKDGGLLVAGGQVATGPHRPAEIYIDVPAIRLYQRTTTTTAPTNITTSNGNGTGTAVGSFSTSVTGMGSESCMFIGMDAKAYLVGGTTTYHLIKIWEWRSTSPANGWEQHAVGPTGTVIAYTVS